MRNSVIWNSDQQRAISQGRDDGFGRSRRVRREMSVKCQPLWPTHAVPNIGPLLKKQAQRVESVERLKPHGLLAPMGGGSPAYRITQNRVVCDEQEKYWPVKSRGTGSVGSIVAIQDG